MMKMDNSNDDAVSSDLSNSSEKSRLIITDIGFENTGESFENVLNKCGFGKFQKILLVICGWALASDSTEIQVVSFVLPAACDLEMTSVEKGWLNAVIFIGMIIGGYAFGGTADIKGRRFVLLWSMTINGVFGLLSAFAPDFALFLILRLLSGIGVGAAMPVLFTYYVEFVPTIHRGPMIGFLASFWMVGNIFTSAVAWLIIPNTYIGTKIGFLKFGSWRLFVAIGAIPSLSSALLFLFVPESPKFLCQTGRYIEAKKAFVRIYRANHKETESIPEEIGAFCDRNNSFSDSDHVALTCSLCGYLNRVADTIKKVFRSTILLFKGRLTTPTVVLVLVWFTLSFGYYGLWMWFPELFQRMEAGESSCGGGTSVNQTIVLLSNRTCQDLVASQTEIYWEAFLIALSNLPGNIATILLINKIGRRALLASSMILSAVSVFFFWMVKTKDEMLAMSCLFSGLSVAGWNALDALAVENYPTHLRSTAFGFQASVGRVAAILANVIFGVLVDVHCSVPILLVASLLCFGGISVFKLPKTGDKALL